VCLFAPITGAWIETTSWLVISSAGFSHPSRVRGLKRVIALAFFTADNSHPSRVRGLKHISQSTNDGIVFAPITGAWIETRKNILKMSFILIRTHHGCVD